jgi:hypothetical protein
MIHLEPRTKYDEAILEEDYQCDVVIYSYESLVEILMEELREHYPKDENIDIYLMAVEWISYNIEGMSGNKKDWPIIMHEEELHNPKKTMVGRVVRI